MDRGHRGWMNMESESYLNLYIGNHGKPDGIEDYIVLITGLMEKRRIRVTVSPVLDPHAVNLVIDEFTNYIENHRMAAFKKAHPQSRIVFILTEFIVRKWGVESFNHFGGPMEAAVISLFDVYLRLVRDDFGPIGAVSVLKLLCYSPLLGLQLLPGSLRFILGVLTGRRVQHPAIRFLQANQRTIYFHMRYLGLKAFWRYADATITSHERVIDGVPEEATGNGRPPRFFGVLYPELDERSVVDNLMVGKKLFMEVTGSVTRYRQRWIERINRKLTSLGLHNRFGACVALPFSVLASKKPVDRGAYSLHPPQTRAWPYSSPTRIFRALSVDHNLPVLTRHFHQNPIEDVCFVFENKMSVVELYEMYTDPARLRKFIEPRVKSYNAFVVVKNDAVAEQLHGLMDTLQLEG
jgi:hypothetical protein